MARSRNKRPNGDRPRSGERRLNANSMQRILVLAGLLGLATFVVLFLKLWNLQVVQQSTLSERAVTQQTREISTTANRGTIYDANGSVLAVSSAVQNIILSPRDVSNFTVKTTDEFGNARSENAIEAEKQQRTQERYDLIADNLPGILGIDRDEVIRRLNKTNSAWEQIASKVEDDVADQVRAFIDENDLSTCLYLTDDSKRYYPYGNLASQVVGFVNKQNKGSYGLEALYNGELSGEDGKIVMAKNAQGTEIPSAYSNYSNATNGYDVHTTLDTTIQMYAEKTLAEGITKFDVINGGFCLVMDPKTGALLAMASSPTYDLNDPNTIVDAQLLASLNQVKDNPMTPDVDEYEEARKQAQFKQWSSRGLNTSYEPGSTFKPIVVAAALEEGAVTENDTYVCTGKVHIGDWDIRCSARRGHGTQSLRKAVMNSCNPALIRIGQSLGADKFYQYWEDFGFTGTTGIELPGEEKSVFWDKELFVSPTGITEQATASFGQRFTTTPIQLITALSAVINGGYLMEPYLVQSVTDKAGNVVSYHEPQEVRQVISEEVSAQMRSILEDVVGGVGGTGKNAYVAGYRIGGKTGSSQTLDSPDHIIVSFLGFAPADDPQVIVLLGYDWPQPAQPGGNTTASGVYISGGNMAAPMAGELIANILDYRGYQKSGASAQTNTGVTIPRLTGSTLAEAQATLGQIGLAYRTSGEGDTVTDQAPAAGSSVPKTGTVVLYLGTPKAEDTVKMPNLIGMSYEEAEKAMGDLGLYLSVGGNTEGTVLSQTVAEGTVLEVGTAVEVQFATTTEDEAVDTPVGWVQDKTQKTGEQKRRAIQRNRV